VFLADLCQGLLPETEIDHSTQTLNKETGGSKDSTVAYICGEIRPSMDARAHHLHRAASVESIDSSGN
jgi:hypothetical protein